ncbi:MAG: transglycosylase SLT domain-containing protein [Bacteroidota bacterium]
MKFPWTFLVAALFMVLATKGHTATHSEATNKKHTFSRVSDELIAERIAHLNLPFDAHNSSHVKAMIRRFTVEGYHDSEDILGRAAIYFPIFEHYLKLYNLPESLKYLPIVESSLKPNAVSPVGAAGLWQFIPSTARLYGLTVNDKIDERLDPHKATEAAVRMLAALYEQFNDWGLALAAYNCGSGRVRRALRYSNGNDYWAVQAQLPTESKRYVPRFIAAAYLMNYYQAHGLQPDYLAKDLMNTRTYYVNQSLHLSTVARQLGISYRTLTCLNPSYQRGLIVASPKKGNFITVPTVVASSFEANYLNLPTTPADEDQNTSIYITVAGDTMEMLARLFQCTEQDIMDWNGLNSNLLTVNQVLKIRLPQLVVKP